MVAPHGTGGGEAGISPRILLEEELRRSQARLISVIDSVTDAIIATGPEGRILLFNLAAERIFRCSLEEAAGEPVLRFLPERFLELHEEGHVRSIHARRADGEEFPAEASLARIEVAGDVLCTVIVRDVTDRWQTQEALRKLSRAVEQSADGVCITDRSGRIEYVNPAYEVMVGRGRDELIGSTANLFESSARDPELHRELAGAIATAQPVRRVFIDRRGDGTVIHLDQSVTPIRNADGEVTHLIATARDITRQIRTEEALRGMNESLEQQARRIAQSLHDEAGQFLTSAHIALAEVTRDLTGPARERLKEVKGHLDRIEEQLRSIAHELRPRILDDLGLVPALEFLAAGVEKRRGIAVAVEAVLEERLPELVETTLYRMIQEATTNATKHARASRIDIRLVNEPGTLRCSVEDDGIGFDGSVPDRGIGLAGIRDRIEGLGGTLSVRSAPGRGTALVITIPLET